MSAASAPSADLTPPRLRVRLACAAYEGLLVFGVLAVAGLAYGLLLRPPGDRPWGLPFQAYLLVVLAAYFVWFWSKGETLAMSTWHLRLQRQGSTAAPSPARALLRFGLSLLAVVPGLLALHVAGLDHERPAFGLVLAGNGLGYALLTRLHPSRQYVHDLLAGTELVRVPGRRFKRRGET